MVEVAWQEEVNGDGGADGGDDWANAINAAGRDAERAGRVDALATIRERTGPVKKRIGITAIEGYR